MPSLRNDPTDEVSSVAAPSSTDRSPDSFNLDFSCTCPGAVGSTPPFAALVLKSPPEDSLRADASDAATRSHTPASSTNETPQSAIDEHPSWHVRHWHSVMWCVETVMPYGGYLSTCFTLCTVTLGGGIVGMPAAFHTSGVVMGSVYLVVVTALTIYSMTILGYAMERTGLDSFENMARGLFGPGGDYFVGLVMWLSCFGTAIAYISGVSSCVSPILTHETSPAYFKTESGNRLVTSLIWLLFMSPLILPKHVNSVRYVSAVSVVFVLFFVVAVVVHSSTNGLRRLDEHRSEIRLFNTNGAESINGLSIFIFAFLCHGVCFPVHFEMRPAPSVKKLTVCTAIAMVTCMVAYLLAGLFGYFDFGAGVEDSILYNYDPVREPLMMIAYLGILLKLVTAYVMNFVPVRNYIYYCLDWNLDTLPYWRHALVMTLLSATVLVIGLFIPSISLSLSLVGSLCGGFIGFIFPALFWMYCGNWSLRSVGLFHYCMTYVLMIVGVVAVVFGTAATIYYTFVASE